MFGCRVPSDYSIINNSIVLIVLLKNVLLVLERTCLQMLLIEDSQHQSAVLLDVFKAVTANHELTIHPLF